MWARQANGKVLDAVTLGCVGRRCCCCCCCCHCCVGGWARDPGSLSCTAMESTDPCRWTDAFRTAEQESSSDCSSRSSPATPGGIAGHCARAASRPPHTRPCNVARPSQLVEHRPRAIQCSLVRQLQPYDHHPGRAASGAGTTGEMVAVSCHDTKVSRPLSRVPASSKVGAALVVVVVEPYGVQSAVRHH